MSLINNEPVDITNPKSSEDLSSPENCGLDGGGSASSSSTMNSDHHHQQNQGFVFCPNSGETVEDYHSLMDFNGSSFFNFDHHQRSTIPPTNNGGSFSFLEGNMSYSSGLCSNSASKLDINHEKGDWLYSDSTIVNTGSRHESATPRPARNKRPSTGEKTQILKKAKPKASTSPKDPQSLAAKNRRERVSERLKVLQELVPNGTKVDLVTMLEKAIGYVKFLQLQVKVLAADEFWPAQGGKAPDITQVKEAIDVILSTSQRDRNSK